MSMRCLNVLLAALWLAACTEPAPGSQAPAGPTQLQSIPAAFHGVWAATETDCEPPAETRLEIAADRLRFYESSGPVSAVEAREPAEILITIPLTGEGAASIRTFRYRLLEDGQVLFDVRNGLTRRRCPTA